jgi:glutathione peroxidase
VTTLADFHATTLDGSDADLGSYLGQAVLVVNTASRCGLTPQYAGLQELHESYADRGLAVLGFPCNQFGEQEPGSESEIGEFCQANYGVSFPMFAKVDVNGEEAHPLWAWLRTQRDAGQPEGRIEWNFTKFLLDPQGRVVERFGPQVEPADLTGPIEEVLPRGR